MPWQLLFPVAVRDKPADSERKNFLPPRWWWLGCLLRKMWQVSSECKSEGLPKASIQKTVSLDMVSSVHRNSFQLAIPGRDKIPAYIFFFFFFLTFNAQKSLTKIILGQADPTGKPEIHQLFGWLHSHLSKDVQTFPKARGIPVTRPSQAPWGLLITENAGQ